MHHVKRDCISEMGMADDVCREPRTKKLIEGRLNDWHMCKIPPAPFWGMNLGISITCYEIRKALWSSNVGHGFVKGRSVVVVVV
jgi:hypothetical protein